MASLIHLLFASWRATEQLNFPKECCTGLAGLSRPMTVLRPSVGRWDGFGGCFFEAEKHRSCCSYLTDEGVFGAWDPTFQAELVALVKPHLDRSTSHVSRRKGRCNAQCPMCHREYPSIDVPPSNPPVLEGRSKDVIRHTWLTRMSVRCKGLRRTASVSV